MKVYDKNGNEKNILVNDDVYKTLSSSHTISGLMGKNDEYPSLSRFRQEPTTRIVDAPTQSDTYIFYTKISTFHIIAMSTSNFWLGLYVNSRIYWVSAGTLN